MAIELWIHTPEGELKPDNPFETIGTKFKLIKADPHIYRSERFVGCVGELTPYDARYNKHAREKTKSGRTRTVQITFPEAYDTVTYGRRYVGRRIVHKSCLELVSE